MANAFDLTDDVIVDLGEPETETEESEATDAPFVFNEDSLNLVPEFMAHDDGIEALKKISEKVIKEFDSDWEASEQYRRRCAENWKLFAGELKEKEYPWKDSANANIPILLKNTVRIVTRGYDELFGDWSNVYGVLPVSPEDEPIAELLSQHGNWQLSEQIEDFPRQQMRGMLAFFLHGDVTFHSFYDVETELNCHEFLSCDEFCTPYSHTTVKANYSDLPRYHRILNLYRHQLEARREEWFDVDAVLGKGSPSWSDEPEQIWMETSAAVQGVEMPEEDESAPYKLIWYEGWLELPTQDRQRWCKAIVHPASKAILLLMIHEQPNWQDRERFNRQAQELSEYRAAHQQFLMAMQDYEAGQAVDQMGLSPPSVAEAAMMQPPPMPPQPPDWLDNPDDPEAAPEPMKREPVYLFSHGVCVEPLVGNLGLSPGRMLADFNRAANTSFSQFTDAATMANCPPIAQMGEFEIDEPDGELAIYPGAFLKMTGMTGDDVRKNMAPIPIQPANSQLLEVVKIMDDQGSQAMQAPEVLGGAPGKSGETYRGLAARVEQASKQLSSLIRVYARAPLKQVLRNNAYLNARFMPDEELFSVQDDKSMASQLQVNRSMYERNYRIVIRADLRFTSQSQKVMEADELVKMGQHPALATNLYFQWHALKKALASRGQSQMIRALGPEPPAPPTPFGIGVDPLTGRPLPPPMPPGMPPGGGTGGPPGQGGPPPNQGP